ncbi:hypothetical protein VSS74_29090 [Conexibacter stalactiti]|uniref:Uncharacterized protein n=1 Tax=Conexibacter stalactiti TaxID=1940611 RepID=A0ABU4HYV2_9ACTN|nr:hypothetical protein [Conexibacter stalactiti]MDW5598451.1 hypothetical protein [Conexibacter stalactiti]MEC5039093.1 hypothetical protein [Conexibacter stalactiti]
MAEEVHTSQVVIEAVIGMLGSLPIELLRLYASLQINSRTRDLATDGG